MTTEQPDPAPGVGPAVDAVLAELPGEAELAELPHHADIDSVARRLADAHDLLVRALEAVERG